MDERDVALSRTELLGPRDRLVARRALRILGRVQVVGTVSTREHRTSDTPDCDGLLMSVRDRGEANADDQCIPPTEETTERLVEQKFAHLADSTGGEQPGSAIYLTTHFSTGLSSGLARVPT